MWPLAGADELRSAPEARLIDDRRALVAGLLQATSLPFIVAATQIGVVIGAVTAATAAAFIAAGLVSALIFPVIASGLLRQGSSDSSRLPIDTAGSTT